MYEKIIIRVFVIIFLRFIIMLVIQNNKFQNRDSLLDAIDESNREYDNKSLILQNIPEKKAYKLEILLVVVLHHPFYV